MSKRIASDHGNSIQERQKRDLAESLKGTMRPKNEDLYWILKLLQDEGWSLWESSDDFATAKYLFEEGKIDFPGEQKALARIIECERKRE